MYDSQQMFDRTLITKRSESESDENTNQPIMGEGWTMFSSQQV